MLLKGRNFVRIRTHFRFGLVSILLLGTAWVSLPVTSSEQSVPAAQSPVTAPPLPTPSGAPGSSFGTSTPSSGLNIVVLDPAHGGTDPGARGTGGIRESDIVLDLALKVRRALEQQGFQVLQTRQGNENPSFDDRSAMTNAQRGAVFVTLHVSSTGLQGTARTYVSSDLPPLSDAKGLILWDRAQAPFLAMSRKFGDLVQGFLQVRFKGSPDKAQIASVRQLRTTAAPAIAVEISNITVEQRAELDYMASGVADAIARGAAEFRPLYVVPPAGGELP